MATKSFKLIKTNSIKQLQDRMKQLKLKGWMANGEPEVKKEKGKKVIIQQLTQ